MRKLTLAALLLLGGSAFAGDHYVSGYTKKDGTYVAPHMQSDANDTKLDNYSTKGNVNPYTGKEGSVDPYAVRRAESSTVKPIAPIAPIKPIGQ